MSDISDFMGEIRKSMFEDDGNGRDVGSQIISDRAQRLANYVSILVGEHVAPDYHHDYLSHNAGRIQFLFRFEDDTETSLLIDRTCWTCGEAFQTPMIRVIDIRDILSAHYFDHPDCKGPGDPLPGC